MTLVLHSNDSHEEIRRKILQSQNKKLDKSAILKLYGSISLSKDPLSIQTEMRNDWNEPDFRH